MSTDLQSPTWQRSAIMAYSGFCYLLFHATFGYLVFFVGDLWVPRTVSGPATELGLEPFDHVRFASARGACNRHNHPALAVVGQQRV